MAPEGVRSSCPAVPSRAPAESRSGSPPRSPRDATHLGGRWGSLMAPTTACVPVTHRLSGFTDSTRQHLPSVTASGFALGWVGPTGRGARCCDSGGCSVLQCMQGARARQLGAIPSPGKAERAGGAGIALAVPRFLGSVSKTVATTHLITVRDCIPTC